MKKIIQFLTCVGLLVLLAGSKKSYSQTETPSTSNYDTVVCFGLDSTGQVHYWSVCQTPKVNGPCDKRKDC